MAIRFKSKDNGDLTGAKRAKQGKNQKAEAQALRKVANPGATDNSHLPQHIKGKQHGLPQINESKEVTKARGRGDHSSDVFKAQGSTDADRRSADGEKKIAKMQDGTKGVKAKKQHDTEAQLLQASVDVNRRAKAFTNIDGHKKFTQDIVTRDSTAISNKGMEVKPTKTIKVGKKK